MKYFNEHYDNNTPYIIFNKKYINNRALKGDYVQLDGNIVINVKRLKRRKMVGILNLEKKNMYGRNKKNMVIYLVNNYNNEYPDFKCASRKVEGIYYILLEFNTWPCESQIPYGNILDYFGLTCDVYSIKRMLYYYYNIPLKQIESNVDGININEKDRRLFFDSDICSIDPFTTVDIDDCFHIEGDKLYIHIADPIGVLENLGMIDILDKIYPFSIYDDENKYMFPSKLTRYMSLVENEKRYAITVEFILLNKKIEDIKIYKSVIINKNKLSYDNFKNEDIHNWIKYLYENNKLNLSREWNNFDSHLMIEYIMLLTNYYVSKEVNLYRCQDETTEIDNIIVREYFKKKAYYSNIKKSHTSLKLDTYTHFTSPMRRLFDIYVHNMLIYQKNMIYDIEYINEIEKDMKKFYYSISFLDKISNGSIKEENIIFIDRTKTSNIFYSETYGIIKKKHYGEDLLELGSRYDVLYSFNMSVAKLKNKLKIFMK